MDRYKEFRIPPYVVELSRIPQLIKWTSGLSTGMLVQPQAADMCYRLDGVLSAVFGFILREEQLHDFDLVKTLVVWSLDDRVGRVVVQEYY